MSSPNNPDTAELERIFEGIKNDILEGFPEESPEFTFVSTIEFRNFVLDQKFRDSICKHYSRSEVKKLKKYYTDSINSELKAYLEKRLASKIVMEQGFPTFDQLTSSSSLTLEPHCPPSPPHHSSNKEIPEEEEEFNYQDPMDDYHQTNMDLTETQYQSIQDFEKRFMYPNLPPCKCPSKFFVSLLRPKYLNALYETDCEAFPNNWKYLIKKDPIQAWHSLNQTIIPYLNHKYSSQGIDIKAGETTSTYLSVIDLESQLLKIINDVKKTQLDIQIEGKTDIACDHTEMKELSREMLKLTKTLNSLLTKFSGYDLKNQPIFVPNEASISNPMSSQSSRKSTPVTTLKKQQQKTKQVDSVDLVFGEF